MPEPQVHQADVVIVGMGAAGSVAAERLTRAGLTVLGLEAGDWYDKSDFTVDELANDRREWLTRGKTSREVPTVRLRDGMVAERPGFATLMMNAVGGTKLHAAGASVRLLPWHFESRSKTIERYGHAALPEGSTVADWPYGYEELEPYYTAIETEMGVSGQAGRLNGWELEGGNPFEGTRSQPYPLPPLRSSGFSDVMRDAARDLGWHPYPHPASIASEPYRGRPACTYCGSCAHNGCHVGAKGLAQDTVLPRAIDSRLLTIRTGARVTEVVLDRFGRASGVVFNQRGRRHEAHASVVLLASFVYENIRLLYLSGRGRFTGGLGNSSGQLGRHFSTHSLRSVTGEFAGRELNTWSGTLEQCVAFDDFNADNFDHTGLGFIGGGRIGSLMEKKLLAAARRPPTGVGRWGPDYMEWLATGLRSTGSVSFTVDELPHQAAYVDLDPTHVDPEGFPVVRVTRDHIENDRLQSAFLRQRAEEWLRAAGATRVWHSPDVVHNVAAHAYGGTRMGEDPATSVTDQFGFLHDVSNLGVLGASTFPNSSGHAPVLTIEATALRTAERVAQAWADFA